MDTFLIESSFSQTHAGARLGSRDVRHSAKGQGVQCFHPDQSPRRGCMHGGRLGSTSHEGLVQRLLRTRAASPSVEPLDRLAAFATSNHSWGTVLFFASNPSSCTFTATTEEPRSSKTCEQRSVFEGGGVILRMDDQPLSLRFRNCFSFVFEFASNSQIKTRVLCGFLRSTVLSCTGLTRSEGHTLFCGGCVTLNY